MNGIFAISAALAAMEAQALKALASSSNPLATKLTTGKALTLSPLYSGVVAVNVVGGTYAMFTLGMKVGKVRDVDALVALEGLGSQQRYNFCSER
jgi:hypothetical protein